MNQIVSQGIILSRTDFSEADRIITLLTPDKGKLRLIAKGVRRPKSRLAGGIELFSVSDITYVKGRGEIGTLISARLINHYGKIVHDVNRTMLGYELIKQLNKVTEDQPEDEYFTLLQQAFIALDTASISTDIIQFWFAAQLLGHAGYSPNLYTDSEGQKLDVNSKYDFAIDDMTFTVSEPGRFSADHIKLLRVAFSGNQPRLINQINGVHELMPELLPFTQTLFANHLQR